MFKATLAWDDPPAVPNAGVALVNDLDLVAIDPGNTTRFPWLLNPQNPSAVAVQGANHRDNIEQVLVNNPAPGTWRIRVTGFNVPQGPQPFSVCATELDVTTGIDEAGAPRRTLPVLRVHPNPFADALIIEFDLEAGGAAAVSIYDAAGRLVRHLAPGDLGPGLQRLVWDGRDEEGRSVPRGVYFVEVRTGATGIGHKVIVTRHR